MFQNLPPAAASGKGSRKLDSGSKQFTEKELPQRGVKSEKQKVMVSLCRVTLAEAHRPAARSDERGGRARTLTVSVTYSCF